MSVLKFATLFNELQIKTTVLNMQDTVHTYVAIICPLFVIIVITSGIGLLSDTLEVMSISFVMSHIRQDFEVSSVSTLRTVVTSTRINDGQIPDIAVLRRPRFIRVLASRAEYFHQPRTFKFLRTLLTLSISQLSRLEESALSGCLFAGMCIGGLVWGSCADLNGR